MVRLRVLNEIKNMIPWSSVDSQVPNTRVNMVYCIGLTGTVASGKSTAAAFFAAQGIAILSADDYAKCLVMPGTPALQEIRTHFGEDILSPDGTLNRRKLRQRIIALQADREWLNACLHPRIRDKMTEALKNIQTAYCVIEIPLLTHREHYPYLNRILLIQAPQEQQIQRLIARDHCSYDEATALLATQPHHEIHVSLADDIIQNDQDSTLFIQQLNTLHHDYLNYSKGANK